MTEPLEPIKNNNDNPTEHLRVNKNYIRGKTQGDITNSNETNRQIINLLDYAMTDNLDKLVASILQWDRRILENLFMKLATEITLKTIKKNEDADSDFKPRKKKNERNQ